MNISVNTLMLAIKAVERDIEWHKSMADAPDASDADTEYHGEYALDLLRALGELGAAYDSGRKGHPEYPSLEDLTRK